MPISRRAVNMALQARIFDPWPVIDRAGYHRTVEGFLKARMGLKLEWSSKFAVPVRLPKDREYLARLLMILRPQILEKAEQERDAMLCYCDQVRLLEDGLSGLVDAGYSGTIQGGLQSILARPMIGLYMLTSLRAAKVRSAGGLAFGCFWDIAIQLRQPGEDIGRGS